MIQQKKESYKNNLSKSMTELGEKDNTIFIGQQLLWYGNPMSSTIKDVPKHKIIEVPVMEESQMGISLGLSMTDKCVITFYPRWDFLICATNQLVNHLDKIEAMSQGTWKPNILIRVGKGSDKPLDPGFQHKGNYKEAFKELLKYTNFYDLTHKNMIEKSYKEAYKNKGINILIEYPELY